MKHLRLAFFTSFSCAVAVALSGCSNAVIHNMAPAGPAPTVANVGVQVNGVAPNRWQYVQFNQAMDPATINSKTLMVADSSGTAVSGNVVYDSNFDVAGFQPSPALHDNASYTLTVTTGAASAQGVHLSSPYTYNFTTRASTDQSPVYVKNVSPFPDDPCVSASSPVTITFSEGVDVNTLNSSNIVITGPGGTVLQAQMSYDVATATVTLTPTAALPSGSITVTVNHVADAAGVAMTNAYAWSFLTTCSGSGGGGGTTTQFQAPLLNPPNMNSIKGQITVDASGNTTVKLTGANANATYDVQFCPARAALSTAPVINCIDLTKISTDGSGNASTTVKFPQSGNWAGDFSLNDSSGKTVYQTWLVPNLNSEVYQAKLLPDTTTNQGEDTTASGQEPLSSGSVSYANGSLLFTVKGASPLTMYSTSESETIYIDSSGTYQLSTFTTDAMGNGSSTTTLDSIGGDLFQVDPKKNDAGFIGGFTVP